MTQFVHAAIEKRDIYSLSLFRMETFTKKKIMKCIGERREKKRKRKKKDLNSTLKLLL